MAGGRAALPIGGLDGAARPDRRRWQPPQGGEEGNRLARRHLATSSSTVTEVHDDALNSTTPRDAALAHRAGVRGWCGQQAGGGRAAVLAGDGRQVAGAGCRRPAGGGWGGAGGG